MNLPKKRKVAKEWTAWDFGLPFYSVRLRLKRIIKKLSSKKMRKFLQKIV
jgi:hypothetical protein